MSRRPFILSAVFLVAAHVSVAEQELDELMVRGGIRESVRARTEGALLQESTALEQAEAQAKSRSDYGLELRPRITDSDFGVGLRIYLPDRWSKDKLREQLMLVARSEQLRVAALEWQQLLMVYRDFCTYRLYGKKLELYSKELEFVEPYLEKADRSVEQHQLAVVDRAKLYSLYLDLLNDQEKVEMELVEVRRRLYLALGRTIDLNEFAETAVIDAPDQADPEKLVKQALENRSDYRRLEVQLQSLGAAEAVARSEEGFRFKYIQPEYGVEFDGNQEQSIGLSAAFVLPWGTRNPDIAVFQQEQVLAVAAMNQHRQMIKERLQVLLQTSKAYGELMQKQQRRVRPLMDQLAADLGQMENLPLEQLRDLMTIRRCILSSQLQTAEAECERQRIAVDFAEELGSIGE